MALRQIAHNLYIGLASELPAELPSGSRYVCEDTEEMYAYNENKVPFPIATKSWVYATAVTNETDIYSSNVKALNIITLTQAEYDAIITPDSATLYCIITP